MEKFNSLAKSAIEQQYFGKGYMGTENATCSFSITENDLDIINENDLKLEAYGKEIDYELAIEEMKIYFSYSEEN